MATSTVLPVHRQPYARRACTGHRTRFQSDQEAALQFDAWLHDLDLPVDAAQIERRHIEV